MFVEGLLAKPSSTFSASDGRPGAVLQSGNHRWGAAVRTYLIVSLVLFAALTLYGIFSGQLALP